MPMNTNAEGRDPGWYDQIEMTLNVDLKTDDGSERRTENTVMGAERRN